MNKITRNNAWELKVNLTVNTSNPEESPSSLSTDSDQVSTRFISILGLGACGTLNSQNSSPPILPESWDNNKSQRRSKIRIEENTVRFFCSAFVQG